MVGDLAAAVEGAVRDVTYELQWRSTSFKWPNILGACFIPVKSSPYQVSSLTNFDISP